MKQSVNTVKIETDDGDKVEVSRSGLDTDAGVTLTVTAVDAEGVEPMSVVLDGEAADAVVDAIRAARGQRALSRSDRTGNGAGEQTAVAP